MYPIITTITAAPPTTALADVVNLRTALGIDAGDSIAVSELTSAIESASAAIANYCGRRFGRTGVLATYNPAQSLALVNTPVAQVTSVYSDSSGNPQLPYTLLDSGLLILDTMPSEFVHISYEGGYDLPTDASPTLPADLEQACIDLARTIYTRRSRAGDVTSELLEGVSSVDYGGAPRGLPLEVLDKLAPYRVIRL